MGIRHKTLIMWKEPTLEDYIDMIQTKFGETVHDRVENRLKNSKTPTVLLAGAVCKSVLIQMGRSEEIIRLAVEDS